MSLKQQFVHLTVAVLLGHGGGGSRQWWIFKIGGLRQNSNKGPVKDSPPEGDESSIIVVTGGRPGPSSHCSLSNHQFKIKQ